MLLLNFSHPLTEAQRAEIETLTGQPIERTYAVMPELDHEQPFAEQACELADAVGLAPDEWQTEPLLVNLPGLAPAAACLLAEIHGRAGHFPAIIRIRPVAGSTPTVYEVAEILNLQDVRNLARRTR
jgi:transposase